MQEKFENYSEAERPGNPVHPLQQIDLSADGIDVSADDIDIPPDETEIMFDSIETAIIGRMASAAFRALSSGAPDARNASYTSEIIVAMTLPLRSK
jgi:hypothetical protein